MEQSDDRYKVNTDCIVCSDKGVKKIDIKAPGGDIPIYLCSKHKLLIPLLDVCYYNKLQFNEVLEFFVEMEESVDDIQIARVRDTYQTLLNCMYDDPDLIVQAFRSWCGIKRN